jgi:hypothetical protein
MAKSNLVDDMKFQDFARERPEVNFGSLSSTESLHNSLLKIVSSSFYSGLKVTILNYHEYKSV